jgi:hypothetical protein
MSAKKVYECTSLDVLCSKTGQPKDENSAKTTFILSHVRNLAPYEQFGA